MTMQVATVCRFCERELDDGAESCGCKLEADARAESKRQAVELETEEIAELVVDDMKNGAWRKDSRIHGDTELAHDYRYKLLEAVRMRYEIENGELP